MSKRTLAYSRVLPYCLSPEIRSPSDLHGALLDSDLIIFV